MIARVSLAAGDISLVPFSQDDVSDRYLGWLNDPVVNEFSRRRDLPPTSAEDARAYLRGLSPNEGVMAIHFAGHGHVGNIKYGPIDDLARRADISIIVGEPTVWGKGVGRMAVSLLSRHLFHDLGLHRVEAGTCNPAFVRMVTAIGWVVEGVLRRRLWIGGRVHDQVMLGQLRDEFILWESVSST